MKNVREVTCKILAMMDEGVLDPIFVAQCALNYLSESEVAEMARINDILFDVDDEDDGQPDETQEWFDYDPDC